MEAVIQVQYQKDGIKANVQLQPDDGPKGKTLTQTPEEEEKHPAENMIQKEESKEGDHVCGNMDEFLKNEDSYNDEQKDKLVEFALDNKKDIEVQQVHEELKTI